MDESATTSTSAPETGAHHRGVLRAMVSAAVFGTIAGFVGNWLGKRANMPNNTVVQALMKWGMAGFSAILGAYSSLKMSAREHEPAQETTPAATPDANVSKSQVAAARGPVSEVEKSTIDHHATLGVEPHLGRV